MIKYNNRIKHQNKYVFNYAFIYIKYKIKNKYK